MQTHNVKWKVATSDGGNFYEEKGNFKSIEGEPSPWQKLDKYLTDNKLEITSLSLYTDFGQTFNLPSAGKNPKFKTFAELEKPLDYNFFHAIGRNLQVSGKEVVGEEISDWFTVIEAVYPSYKLQLWVDEQNPKNCWVLVAK